LAFLWERYLWERSLPAKNDNAMYLKKSGAFFAAMRRPDKLRSHRI